ncbi:MAG: FAD-dependent oxidoreductase [Polyangiaceae bacterium]
MSSPHRDSADVVKSSGAGKKVAILGGGVAGMSAAHELVERGFCVEVFERKAIPGGKARSIAAPGATTRCSWSGRRGVAGSRAGGVQRPPLPGEHGFRFFPGFYKHVVDTMARIPYKGASVAQNLVGATELRMASFDRPSFVLPSEFPRTENDVRVDLYALVALLAGQSGVPAQDAAFFAEKTWQFVTSCEERRMLEYERTNWWDFIEAGSRSVAYQTYFGSGFTRSLVAAKARRASTKTVGDIFMQMLFGILMPSVSADRVLNGPTNDVWVDPWLEYLRERGVVYHLNSDVRAIRCSRGLVQSASVSVAGRFQEVTADYFVAALPVERMAELVTPELTTTDPSLANLGELTEYVEWMNGIQYYLTEDVPVVNGHAIYVDSPWALTSISQPQFWRAFDLTKYGDGSVKGLLSVDVSDWDVKGLNGKEARYCTREEIAIEVWEELKRSLNGGGREVLLDSQLHSWFLDPDIADADPSTPNLETNGEPLLVNYVDTWRLRPEAYTRIPNFFLASDYVRTYTDLATMEAANEAARRAVNAIIRASGVDVPPCEIWNLQEPEMFLPMRAYDRIRFRKGLPWDGASLALAQSVLRVAEASRTEDQATQTGPTAETAAAARSSSDAGLRRLRIVG